MKLKITSANGGVRYAEFHSEGGVLTIGREKDNDIILPDKQVSRHHARVVEKDGHFFVEDLKSTSGTLINESHIPQNKQMPLGNGDRVRICTTHIELEESMEPYGKGRKKVEVSAECNGHSDFAAMFKDAALMCTKELMDFKKRIHDQVLQRINPNIGGDKASAAERDAEAERCLDQVLREFRHEIPDGIQLAVFRQALLDELIGLGPISPMLRKKEITEVMVNGPERIFVECRGRLQEAVGVRFYDEKHLIQIIQRIVEPLGRHVDDASPMVDARLADGSRVNAIVKPLSIDGASLTIRKFAEKKLTTDDLINFGSMTRDMALFLEEAVRARQNILVSGGTGSGKTTLLNILSQFIPEGERLVTVEDSAELKLSHRNIVRLEARPANVEGKGRVTIRDLVINCLRMRPDRIIVGECRGAEALDMLQAMNTGHDGSLTTAHANNPRDVLSRLENMVMMAGFDLPSSAIREQIASAIDIIVQQTRLGDGSRKIVKIVEVTGREGDVIQMQDIFEFRQTGIDAEGNIQGMYSATGNIPFFIEEQRKRGVLRLSESVFVPKV